MSRVTSGMGGETVVSVYMTPHVEATPHRNPNRGHVTGLIDELREHMDGLDIVDPSGALDAFQRVTELKAEARAIRHDAPSSAETRRGIERALARGEIDGETASKRLAKARIAEGSASASDLKSRLFGAAEKAYKDALKAVYDFGEDRWLDVLRPLATAAIESGDTARWDQVHELAAHLRKIGGLATVGAPDSLHRFGRPDLVREWQLEHCQRDTVREVWPVGRVTVANTLPKGAPRLTAAVIREHPEWRAGLHSAAEVLENVKLMNKHRNELIARAQQLVEERSQSRMRQKPKVSAARRMEVA